MGQPLAHTFLTCTALNASVAHLTATQHVSSECSNSLRQEIHFSEWLLLFWRLQNLVPINTASYQFSLFCISYFHYTSEHVSVPTERGCLQHVASQACKSKVIRYTFACDADVKMSASDERWLTTVMCFSILRIPIYRFSCLLYEAWWNSVGWLLWNAIKSIWCLPLMPF